MVTGVQRSSLAPGQWDAFVDGHPEGWFFHTSHWIDYAVAYDATAEDHSVAVFHDGRMVGVVPMTVSDTGVTYGGQPLAAPLFRPHFNVHIDHIDHPALVAQRPGLDLPECFAVEVLEETTWETAVVNLQYDEADLWKNLRKSYHALINKAQRTAQIMTIGQTQLVGGCEHPIEEARRLHIASAGRETRPVATWEMMARWMEEGFGVLALAAVGGEMRAYAYAIRYKDWAYYMSGASLEPNLQHALIWQLMRTLRQDGERRYFEVGWLERAGDSEKEKNIAFFKEGFGGTRWTVHAIRRAAAPARTH